MKRSIEQITKPSIPTSIVMLVGCLVLWLPDFLSPGDSVECGGMMIPYVPATLLCVMLTIACGVGLSLLLFKLYVTRTRSVFATFIYILTVSCVPLLHTQVEAHVCALLYVGFVVSLLGMYKDAHAVKSAYNAGLLLAVLALFEPYFLLLIPFWQIGIMMQRSWSLRTFLASVLGMLTPAVLVGWGCYFMQIEMSYGWEELSVRGWSVDTPAFCQWLVWCVFLLWIIVLLYLKIFSYSIKSRMVMNVMLLLSSAMLVLSFLTAMNATFVVCCMVTCLMYVVQWAHSNQSSFFIWINLAVYGAILAVIYICGMFGYGMA